MREKKFFFFFEQIVLVKFCTMDIFTHSGLRKFVPQYLVSRNKCVQQKTMGISTPDRFTDACGFIFAA
jgi:hypothetical protein